MSFDARENSIDNAQPIRLYRFNRGNTEWCYNTSDRPIMHDARLYSPVAGGISDNGIRMSGDPQADALIIKAPADLSVVQQFRNFAPSDSVELVVFDTHYKEPEARLSWRGTIESVNWPTLNSCKISCQSMDIQMAQPGLTMSYSRSCTAVLGDSRCKVNLVNLRVAGTVQSKDGVRLYIPELAGFADGYFTAGYVEWSAGDSQYNRRHIDLHSGSYVSILGGTHGIAEGAIRIYPGCNFLATTCQNKFNNINNFRGIPHLQGGSPFDGNNPF